MGIADEVRAMHTFDYNLDSFVFSTTYAGVRRDRRVCIQIRCKDHVRSIRGKYIPNVKPGVCTPAPQSYLYASCNRKKCLSDKTEEDKSVSSFNEQPN